MRCLITGADGRLGRALTRAMTGRPDLTVWSLPKDRLDITSRSALERCMREFRPDWVVNAAAVTRAPEDRFYEYDRVNAEGAGFVAEATRAAGARILQVSTDYVFSGEGEAPWCERDRPSARGPYGRSKEEGEYAVMRSGAAGYIVRAGWLHSGERDFVDAILTRAARGEILRVVDKQVGKPSETEAFAAWLVRVLTECPAPSRLEIEHYVERGDYVYCGCPEGRGFDEPGERGFVLLTAEKGKVAHTFVPFAARTIHEERVDVSGCRNAYQAYTAVRRGISFRKDDIYRILLTGEVDFDVDGLAADVEKQLEGSCCFCSVKDKTERTIDIAKFRGDLSVRGEFVRTVLAQADMREDEKMTAIRCGLRALENKEIEL